MRRITSKLIVAALLFSGSSYAQKSPAWLENSVIYQVYPSSYKDSDGNGIGDIQGVISKLDYIESLGVGAIWFNPLFVSGWIDGGYDVIDFYRVDPRFGTNNDLVELIQKAHEHGIHVFLDLVAGHTSDRHPWFCQSAEDTNLQYSDYYIWSDRLPDAQAYKDLDEMLKSDDPMQNTRGKWMQSDAPRDKFYYKNFYACQPALNYGYANPDPSHPWEQSVDAPGPRAVRQELKDILAFWYDKGVDGFRVDLAYSLVKNDADYSETMNLWHEIRSWQDEHYPDHVLMAEWDAPLICLGAGFNVDMNLNSKRTRVARRMYYDGKSQANGGAYFSLNGGKPSTYDLYGNPWPEDMIDRSTTPAEMLKTYFEHFENAHNTTKDKGYYASITGNHDHLRFNMGDRNNPEQLKVMMAWIMTMPLPILYYGDEIGMRSLVNLPNVEGANHNGKERSGARTPMQWDGTENAGFSTCAPENIYLPVCPEWTSATSYDAYLQWKADGCKKPTSKGMITVESQDEDPESLLNWTRSLIALRKGAKPFWASSDFKPVFDESHPYPMVYTRSDGKKTYLIALNPTGVKQSVMLSGFCGKSVSLKPVLSSGKASCKLSAKGARLEMGPTSVLICQLPSSCAPKSEEYSVVMLGDTHFDALDPELYHAGYTDPNPVREANHRKEFVRNADAWRGRCKELTQRAACLVDKDTRYVFQVGDLIQGDTADTASHKRFMEDAYAYFKSVIGPDIPFVSVAGNHDIRGNDDTVALKAYEEYMTRRLSKELGRTVDRTSFVFRCGPDAYIALNYFTADYDMVESLLEQAGDARHIFLLVHTPVFPFDDAKYWWWHLMGDRNDSRRDERLRVRQILASHNVIVLCGHVHTTEFLDWYGDGGRITQMTMSSLWTREEQGMYAPIAETPDQYGTLFVNDLPIFDECRSGVKTYSLAQSAGSYKLIVGDKVYVDYYAGNSPRLSKRFILRG